MDINLVKKRRRELNDKISRNTTLWKPKSGTSNIRILPYKANPKNPFIELWWHWNVGSNSILCLSRNFGDKCPICEFATDLWKSNEKDDKELAKDLFANLRFYTPVAVRGAGEEGPKYWGFGKSIYESLTDALQDPQCGDFTDIESGRDIEVTYKTPEQMNNKYGKVTAKVSFSQSPLHDDAEIVQKLLEEQKDIFEIYPRKEYDEVISILKKWLHPDESDSHDLKFNNDSEDDDVSKMMDNLKQNDTQSPNKETNDDTSDTDDESDKDIDEVKSQFDKLFNTEVN